MPTHAGVCGWLPGPVPLTLRVARAPAWATWLTVTGMLQFN
jgi:hypothetical protein